MERPSRRAGAWAATAAAGTLLATHFAMTFLHVTPTNPVKVEHEAAVRSWTEPLFEQNWQLFAPNPIAVDQGLLVKARYADGRATQFTDLTTPHLLEKHHSVLPGRRGFMTSGVVTRFIEARESAGGADADSVFLTDAELSKASEGDRQAYRDALADLRDAAANGLPGTERPVAVQIRLVQHTFPRYSQRHHQGPGEITHGGTSAWIDLKENA